VKRQKAQELRAAWGDRPCPHPSFAKEYDMGERTGNFVCVQCGTVFSFRDKAEIMQARRAPETE